MNWYYKISQKADPRIDYKMDEMVPYQPSYWDIGHTTTRDQVFLWYVDKFFRIHTTNIFVNGKKINHAKWDEYIEDEPNNIISQGRYEVETGRVSLGGDLEFHFKNIRAFNYAKERIMKLLYKTFGGAIKIVDFT